MISIDDPRREDIRELLGRHLVFVNAQSPPEDVHALDLEGLLDPSVTFFSFRADDQLLGVGALKQLDGSHAELKSMHTAQEARGRGVGAALVDHLIRVARDRGFRRLSLETGSMDAFAPARALYERAGFRECGPFGEYLPSPNSTFMTLSLRDVDQEPAAMHPNEELIRREYEARARGDLAAVAALFHDDIVWHVPGRSSISGTYRGKDGAISYVRKRQALADGSLEITVHDVLANERHGLVVASGRATRNGREWHWRGHGLYRFAEGKIAEVWLLPEDLYLFDEIWS